MEGARLLRNGAFDQAEQAFAHAVALNPARGEYLAALALAREHRITDLLQQAAAQRPVNPAEANSLVDRARAIDPQNPRVLQHEQSARTHVEPTVQTRLGGAIALQPNATRHSYHERADIRSLATRIATEYGLRVTLDADLNTQMVRMDADDLGFDDALRILKLVTHTMSVPLDEHTFVLASDTAANRTRLERLVEETLDLPGFSGDQLKDLLSIAQTIFDFKQVSVSPGLSALILRGPADQIEAANRIFADLLKDDSDVVLDLKLYEVNRSHVRDLGVQFPSSISGYSLAAEAQTVVSQNTALIQQLVASGILPSTATTAQIAEYLVLVAGLGSSTLLTNSFLVFGGGVSTGVLSAGSIPMINLALSNSDARTIDDVQLRGSQRQTITFKVGERYPIQTSLFSDIATGSSSLTGVTVNGVSLSSLLASYLGTSTLSSSAVIPQIEYQDLGLVVTAVPRVLRTSDVGMKIEVKISALAGTSLNGIPILTSRQFSSDLTLPDGATAMLVSNTSREEDAAITGLPGLSEVPGFQSTTNDNGDRITGDLVLLITPHIVTHSHTSPTGPYVPLQPHPEED